MPAHVCRSLSRTQLTSPAGLQLASPSGSLSSLGASWNGNAGGLISVCLCSKLPELPPAPYCLGGSMALFIMWLSYWEFSKEGQGIQSLSPWTPLYPLAAFHHFQLWQSPLQSLRNPFYVSITLRIVSVGFWVMSYLIYLHFILTSSVFSITVQWHRHSHNRSEQKPGVRLHFSFFHFLDSNQRQFL